MSCLVIMRIHMLAGRTREQKRQLIRSTTDVAVQSLGVHPDDVRIVLLEIERENWGIAGTSADDITAGKG